MPTKDPSPKQPAKFKRFRTLEELRVECRKKRWPLQTEKYEAGSDYVSVQWRHGRMSGNAVISMVNGVFFGETASGQWYSSDEIDGDSQPWFMALLNLVYVR